jgi:DNA-binding transcriptional MerR regulator
VHAQFLSRGQKMSNFTVTEMARESGLTPHTLRYYEKEFLLLDVPRDSGGRRLYGENHLGAAKFITALRATGMSIRSIKQYIELYREGTHTAVERLDILECHEQNVISQLAKMKESLKLIRKKIGYYNRKAHTRC